MRFQKLNIATARIKGLKGVPYYFEHKCYFALDIMFYDTSSLGFNNITQIKVGDTRKEGRNFCNQLRDNFGQANIHEKDRIAVIYTPNGCVKAISRLGQDLWIDVEHGFTVKTFRQLNLRIKSLTIH